MKQILTPLLFLLTGTAFAQETATYETTEAYDDVLFAVEAAILDEGLVIDNHSHIAEMLARTGADVGSETAIYAGADVFSFCSASLSRAVMERDPENIIYCPYGIFVYARAADPDRVTVGYRTFPEGPMKEVESLLDRIVRNALDLK